MSKINKSPRVLDLFDADMNQICCKPISGYILILNTIGKKRF